MTKTRMASGAALAVLCGTLLAGCAATADQTASNGYGAAGVGMPNNTGQTIWRKSCGSYDNFGARLSVDQCGGHGGGFGPFIR